MVVRIEQRRWFLAALAGALMLSSAPVSAHAQSQEVEEISVTLAELGYGDQTLTGIYGTTQFWLPVPDDWALEEKASIHLVFSHSPLLDGDRSTLTVAIGAVPYASTALDDSNAAHGELTVPISLADFAGGGILISVQHLMRTGDDECEPFDNPATWAIIHAESSITLSHYPRPVQADLSLLPYPFVVSDAVSGAAPVTFVLPSAPSSTTLEAALAIAARLGQWAGAAPLDLAVVAADEIDRATQDQHNLIVVGTAAEQPFLATLAGDLALRPDSRGRFPNETPFGAGVIQMLVSPWNKERGVLVVTAEEQEGLELATVELTNPTVVLTGSIAIVTSTHSAPPSPWAAPTTTFRALGGGDVTLRGIGEQSVAYYFSRPKGWVLDDKSCLYLHLAFSPVSQSSTSYARVTVNDLEIASFRLDQVHTSDSFYRLPLPASQLNWGQNGHRLTSLVVRLTVWHQVEEAHCDNAPTGSVWTELYGDSYWDMAPQSVPMPELGVYPFPFRQPEQQDPPLIVLPSIPSSHELEAALRVAASLGRSASGQPPAPDVIFLDEANDTRLADQHLILIGDTSLLPAQSANPLAATDTTTATMGILVEQLSPWNQDRVVLIVSAGEDKDMPEVAQALNHPDLSGSLAVVEAHDRIAALSNNALAEIPTSTPAPTPPGWTAPSVIQPSPAVVPVDPATPVPTDPATPVSTNPATEFEPAAPREDEATKTAATATVEPTDESAPLPLNVAPTAKAIQAAASPVWMAGILAGTGVLVVVLQIAWRHLRRNDTPLLQERKTPSEKGKSSAKENKAPKQDSQGPSQESERPGEQDTPPPNDLLDDLVEQLLHNQDTTATDENHSIDETALYQAFKRVRTKSKKPSSLQGIGEPQGESRPGS